MKRLLYFLCITGLLPACHKSDTMMPTAVDPIGLLYRRWQAVAVSDTYITFLAEGIILYGPDGTFGTCCQPRTFIRQDSVLNFRNVPPKTIPAFVQKADCSTVKCAPVPDSWTIVTLTTDRLVLKTPYGNQAYQPD